METGMDEETKQLLGIVTIKSDWLRDNTFGDEADKYIIDTIVGFNKMGYLEQKELIEELVGMYESKNG